MNKIILLLSVVVFGLGFSGMASAGGYTGKSEITWFGTIFGDQFVMSGNWTNVLNCSNMSGNMWRITSQNGSMDELKVMYSAALSAYMAGKTVELYAHECGSDGRPHARSLYLPSRSGN